MTTHDAWDDELDGLIQTALETFDETVVQTALSRAIATWKKNASEPPRLGEILKNELTRLLTPQ